MSVCLEPLQKCDQGVLVSFAQARFSSRELVCTKIMSTIDNQVRTLAELKEGVYDIGKNLSGFFVARPLGQFLQISTDSEH